MSAASLSQDLVHAMPFGAEPVAGRGVRFRLWAPAANTVDLVFENRSRPMEKTAEGWFQLIEPSARHILPWLGRLARAATRHPRSSN